MSATVRDSGEDVDGGIRGGNVAGLLVVCSEGMYSWN